MKHDDQGEHDERSGSEETSGRGKRRRPAAAEQREAPALEQLQVELAGTPADEIAPVEVAVPEPAAPAEAPTFEQLDARHPGDEQDRASASQAQSSSDAKPCQDDLPQALPPWDVKPWAHDDEYQEHDFHTPIADRERDSSEDLAQEQCEAYRADPVPGETERIRDASRRLAAGEAVEVGAGVYRWTYRKQGGISRSTSVVLPPPPSGCAWSSAQVTTRGGRTGRGEGGVSANVSKTASGIAVAQVDFSGSGCTALDFLLFADVLA